MRRLLALALYICFALLITNCYVETRSDRSPARVPPLTPPKTKVQHEVEGCRHAPANGCIFGQIAAAPGIYVEAEEVFDAADVGIRLTDLVAMQKSPDESADVEILTPLENRNFSKGFMVFTRGAGLARAAPVRRTGGFAMNDLLPGEYTLRVQRPVRMQVTYPDGEASLICATLFAEELVTVERATQIRMVIEDYEVRLQPGDCST